MSRLMYAIMHSCFHNQFPFLACISFITHCVQTPCIYTIHFTHYNHATLSIDIHITYIHVSHILILYQSHISMKYILTYGLTLSYKSYIHFTHLYSHIHVYLCIYLIYILKASYKVHMVKKR